MDKVDLFFSQPSIELIPQGDPLAGDFVRVAANIGLVGTQNWTRYGPIMDKGSPGDPDDAQVSAPSVLFEDGEYKMWYMGDPGTFPTAYIMYANSSDGISWVKRGVVLNPLAPQERQVAYPCVMKDGSTYKMWYSGYDNTNYRIFYATSPDGIVWTRQGMVLNLGSSGFPDDFHVLAPFVLKEGPVYRMWYNGHDGTNARVMYVESSDGVNWGIRQISLDLGPPGAEDSTHVSYPYVYAEGGTYHLWYTGNIGTKDRIFYAASTDGKTWKRMGKVLDLGPVGGDEDKNIGLQHILHLPGKPYQMWYMGRGTVSKIFYATFNAPVALPIQTSVDFYLDIIAPGAKIGSSVAQVGGLSMARAEIVWQATPTGGHTIFAAIDETNAIVENNETNNIASMAVRVVSNSPPVADAGAGQSVYRNANVVLDGTASYDPQGDPITFVWVQTSGFPLPMFGGNTATPIVLAYLSGVYNFLLTVYDDHGGVSSDVTNVTVTNRQPAANAGPDRAVGKGTLVMLDGAGSSDPDFDILAYSWIQTSGTPVTLVGADSPTPTFMPLTGGVCTFELTVDDGDGGIDFDAVSVNVTNSKPIADAGPDLTIKKKTMATLVGTGSNDPDGDALTYSWTQTGGPAVTLNGADSPVVSFTPLSVATYAFNLTVDDGSGGVDADSVKVNVTDTGPVANAGPDVDARKHHAVILDGSGSYDVDGDALTYLWTKTSGPAINLIGPTTVKPIFTPVYSGIYTFCLNVTDIDGIADSDFINVNVTNASPRAYAGLDTSARKKTVVNLDGAGSTDADGDPLTYAWVRIAGPAVIIVDSDSAVATFTPLISGTYGFQLTVGDGDGGISADVVSIIVTNTDPLADAGADIFARKNGLVTLDGTDSTDADGDVLSCVWTKISGPTVALAGIDTCTPSFTPSSVGAYSFRLAVSDGDGGTDTDTVTVVVYGLPPVARVTSGTSTVEVGSSISFDAGASTDQDGSIETYQFEFGDGQWDNVTTPQISHRYYEAGVYVVTLTAVDDDGNMSTARLTIKVTASPHNILADIWWLLAIIVILAANTVYFALEWRRWKTRAQKSDTGEQGPVVPAKGNEKGK